MKSLSDLRFITQIYDMTQTLIQNDNIFSLI